MNVLQCAQGSDSWKQIRLSHFTASEAPAMLGVSKYTSRSDLLRLKSTGIEADVSQAKQRLFDAGHQAEAAARSIAESIIGQDLFPIVGTKEVEGLPLLASFDGVVMDESIVWETKLWNESLAQACIAGELEAHYWAQLEQQLIVSGADKALFTTSDGTKERTVQCWYTSVPERRAALIAGWHQFAQDLAAYVPPEVIVPAVAAPQMGLPAVSITVNGSIALVDNLDKFGAALTAYVERINKKPETDQDFADLEATVKTLKNAEDALDAAESGALAQTDSIDAMRKTVALYRETARTNRLLIEKLVKAEKENRRIAIVSDAIQQLDDHIFKLNARIGRKYMPHVAADFQGVVKGLKSLDSMKDKVSTELARCKIAANEVADRIQANLTTLAKLASEHAFLFADMATLVLKANDDLVALVEYRIASHKAAEAAKEEATRARIRAEEQTKAETAAREKLAAEQAAFEKLERDETARLAKLNATMVTEVAPAVTQVMMPATVRQAMAPKPTAKPETPPTLTLGEISTRLGFNVTSAFLATLGFEAATVKAAKLYHEDDFKLICEAITTHIRKVQEQFEAVAA